MVVFGGGPADATPAAQLQVELVSAHLPGSGAPLPAAEGNGGQPQPPPTIENASTGTPPPKRHLDRAALHRRAEQVRIARAAEEMRKAIQRQEEADAAGQAAADAARDRRAAQEQAIQQMLDHMRETGQSARFPD
jgi:hypothetical protein